MEILSVVTNAANLRYVDVHGRQFAIANIKIIVPGVLNGSKGALYYPADEIAIPFHVHSWNGRPMVVYHPQTDGGLNISANNPETFIKQEIGRVFNAKIDHTDGGLDVEGWFDIELTKKHDARIWNALVSKNKIEVSTGLYTENEKAPDNSTYKGKPYAFVAKNYRPDHLAILPDEKGACSVKDGCGVFNKAGEQYPEKCPHCDTALEIDPDSGICNRCSKKVEPVKNGGSDKDKTTIIDKDKTALADNNTSLTNPIGNTMDRTKAIQSLTVNCAYKGADAQANLLKLSDAEFNKILIDNAGKIIEEETKNEDTKFLQWMSSASEDVQKAFVGMMKKQMMGRNAAPAVVSPEEEAKKKMLEEEEKKKALMAQQAAATGATGTVAANADKGVQVDKDTILKLFPELNELIGNYTRVVNNGRAQLVNKLTASITDNARKQKLTAVYNAMKLEDLEELAAAVPTQNTQQPTGYNFLGAAGGVTSNNDGYDVSKDILEVPVVNWAEESKLTGSKS